MSIREKFKTITKSSETKLNTIQPDTAKRSALSSGNVSKYESFTGKDVSSEKDLEKAATIKRFEYSLLFREFKKQTSVAEKQHQKFNKKEEQIKRLC